MLHQSANTTQIEEVETEAVEIYSRKLAFLKSNIGESQATLQIKTRHEWSVLSEKYLVRTKAIKDIWTRKTWVLATSHLWELE